MYYIFCQEDHSSTLLKAIISTKKKRDRTGRDHINELQNYFGVSIKDIESKPTKFIEVVDEETNHI